MPLYDYECQKCGTQFEESCRLDDADSFTPNCPECGTNSVNKIIKLGYGGIQDEHPLWMRGTVEQIVPEYERKPENRKELMDYMKKEGLAFRDKGFRGPAFI